jgi:hypothetical protein
MDKLVPTKMKLGAWAQCYNTFSVRNLQIFIIS